MNENLRNLYNTLISNGYNPPAFEQFVQDMQDENNLRGVYNTLQKEGYKPPKFDTFKTDMGYVSPQAQQQAQPAKPVGQVDVSVNAGITPNSTVQQPTWKQTPEQQRVKLAGLQHMTDSFNQRMEQQRQDFHTKMDNMKKVAAGHSTEYKFNPMSGKMERTYYTDTGKEVSTRFEQSRINTKAFQDWETNTPEGQEHRRWRIQRENESRLENAIYRYDPDNAAEAAWETAEARTKAAREQHNKEIWDDYTNTLVKSGGMIGGREMRVVTTAQATKSNIADYLTYHDLQRMADDAWNNLGTEKQQQITQEIYGALRNLHPEATEDQLAQAAREMARQQSDQRLFELAVEKNAPKSATEMFFRKAIGMNSILKLTEAMARSSAGTTGDWEAREVAEQRANHGWNQAAGVGGTVAGFVFDPLTILSAGAGSGAVKGATWLGGRYLGQAATRQFATTLGGRLASGAIGGAFNFGTYEAGSEAIEQAKWGGHRDEATGEVGDYSLGAVAGKFGHGFVMGAATGVVAPLLGNVSDKLVRATESTVGKAGIRVGELGVGTVAEGTIFSIPEWIEGDRDAMDVWTDNMAMMAGFRGMHMIKSAPRVIGELSAIDKPGNMAERTHNRMGFEGRLRKALDGTRPDLALTADEKAELERGGYGDLNELVEDYGRYEAKKAQEEAYKGKRGDVAPDRLLEEGELPEGVYRDIPYNRFTDLMTDGNISEAARAKMYYYLTGHTLPMSTVIASSDILENKDSDGNVKSYTVQSYGGNGVITSRTFTSRKAAEAEQKRIDRQAELNAIDVGERYFDRKGDYKRMEQACKDVAKEIAGDNVRFGENAYLWRRLYELMQKKPEDMSDVERKVANKILDAYDKLGDEFDYEQYTYESNGNIFGVETERVVTGSKKLREDINHEFGVDIDKAVKKEPFRRSGQEQKAVEEYAKRLFADVKFRQQEAARNAEPRDPNAPTTNAQTAALLGFDDNDPADPSSGMSAPRRRGYNAGMQERRDIAIELADPNNADNPDVQEAWNGVVQRINEDAAYMAALDREQAKQMQHSDGSIRPATLKEADDNGNTQQVYIVDGHVNMMPDGSRVDPATSDKSIVIYNPATGERTMIDPTSDTGLATVGEVTTVAEHEAKIEANRRRAVQGAIDAAQGTVRVVPGEQMVLPTGEPAVVVAVDDSGENITVRLDDGTQQNVLRSELQRIADEAALLEYRQRHGIADEPTPTQPESSETPAQAQPSGVVDGAPAEYAEGMELTVRDDDGTEKPAMVMGMVRAEDGKLTPDPNGKIVEYYMDGEVKHSHIDTLNDKVVSHVPLRSEAAPQAQAAEGVQPLPRPVIPDVKPEDMTDEAIAAEIQALRDYDNHPATTDFSPDLVNRRDALLAEQERRRANAPVAENEMQPAAIEAGTEEPQQPAEPMPMREVGTGKNAETEPDWLAVTPERGHDWLFGESGLARADANEIVKNNLEAAQNAVKKAGKLKPKKTTNPFTLQAERERIAGEQEAAQRTLDYWNAVQARQTALRNAELERSRAEQAEEMLANIQKDVSRLATEDRAMLLGQEEALQEYIAGLENIHYDRQGNPVDADGNLILEEISSVDELKGEDFSNPTRNVQLPKISERVDKAIGAGGKPVIIKKNIFEKNKANHPELKPSQSRKILKDALYSTNLYGQTQPKSHPNYWVVIRTSDPNKVVVLEVSENKDNVEIVSWRYAGERQLEELRKQAEREDGQLLILTSEKEAAAGLSTLPSDVSAGKVTDLFGNEQGKVKKSSSEAKIEDVGERLEGARKDMRRKIAESLANVTEAALIEKPFGKVYKKPDLKKAVESGALREKDAIFYEALFSMINQQKPKVTQSEMRSKRYIPDYKTKAERWASSTYKAIETLRQFMEADEAQRDALIDAAMNDRYPNREKELAEIEQRKRWNPDREDHKYEWGDKTTPNPLWVTYEVMNRMGYNVGDKLDIPFGVVEANTSGTGYSIKNLKGERASLFGSSMSINEAVDAIVYLARLKRGDADISHPTQLFAFPATKSEMGESGRYRVMWGRDYKTREFDSKEEADAFAATKSGAYVSPINEVKRRFGYKVRFYHPLTGEKMFVDDAEFDTKDEAQAYFDGNFEKLNEATNAKLQEEREKKGEKKTLTADDVVHVTMVHSGKGGWTHAVVIDKKYANNDGQVLIIKEGFASRKDAKAFADSVKDDVLKTVLKHKEDAKKIVYFDTGENSRIGEDYRNGKNVDAEDFMNTFGFRGVQFGNWTNQADRQMAVNQAYDAFMDMAKLIGISPKAMSLNGELGIAFGARGVGGFAAHYEPGEVVINLTKTNGAGSLAHEWWHALDNYFARRAGSAGDMVTDNRRIAMRDELRKAFNDMLDMIKGSDYLQRSTSKGEYWGRTHEVTARLLAEWVDKELKKRGELNTFLSRGAVVERGQQANYATYSALEVLAGREPMPFDDYKETPESLKGIPYPSAKEVEQFGESLRHIFDTLEEKVDEETGNVMLYEPSFDYRTKDGGRIKSRSLFDEMGLGDDAEVAMVSQQTGQGSDASSAFAPSDIRLRKLRKGETCHVERVYEETKQFDFTGKEKVESAEDVAYIFRQLENAAVENSFLVLVKGGKPTVIHLGVGSYVNVMAPYEQALVAYRELKPEQVYFVHNHPSGVLKASRQDQELLKRVKMAFGEDVVQQGIIIDTTSGKYGEFDMVADNYDLVQTSGVEAMPQSEGADVPVKVYQFSRQVFAPDWNPESAFKIVSSQSVAEFVSSHRLGEHKKMSFLVVNNSGNVVANVFLPWTKLSDIKRSKDAGDLLAGYVHQCGGVRGVLYGNYDYEADDRAVLAAVGGRMRQLNAPLMDALHVEHSAYENGWAGVGEPSVGYGVDATPFHNIIDEMFGNEDFDKSAHARERYDLGATPEWMKGIGISGERFTLSFKNIKTHLGKDADHNLTAKEWHELPSALKHPFLVTSYGNKDGKFRLYTTIKVGDKFAVVGVDVVRINQGKGVPMLELNRIKTVFGRDRYVVENGERILAWDKNITPEQEALLRGHNYREYPTIQELSAAKIGNNSDITKENGENITEDTSKVKRTMQEDASMKRRTVEQMGKRLNTPIKIYNTPDEVTHSDPEEQARRRKSKGWYDPNTREIGIVLSNNADVDDVKASVGHETIAHHGLRELVGEERYDEFLDEVYDHLDEDLKKGIDEKTNKAFYDDVADNGEQSRDYEQHRRQQVDELFGEMAEKPFDEFSEGERTLWQKIKASVRRLLDKFLGSLKLPKWFTIGDNELRYMLWRSKERLEHGKEHPIDLARDIVKREELVLDGDTRYAMGDAPETFRARQQRAVSEKGVVMPGLNEAEVKVVDISRGEDGKLHPFDETLGATELKKQVRDYARSHGDEILGDADFNGDKVNVSLSSISEMADPKSIKNSISKEKHLAALLKIKEIISNSVDAEVHPDYIDKDENGKRVAGKANPNILIHRVYGAVNIDGETYRVKTTIKEIMGRDKGQAYTYEVTNIELLEDHKELDDSRTPRTTSNSISAAKLLQNIEKAYDLGKKLLEESKKADKKPTLYRPGDTDDIWNDMSLGLDERITAAATRLANNHRANRTMRDDAMRAIGGNLTNLRRAMSLQRKFDMTTVKRVADLARVLMDSGHLDGLSATEVKRLLAAVKNSVGHNDIEASVQRVMDIMVDNQLKKGEATLHELETIKATTVDARGVEVQGQLDPAGAHTIKVFKKSRGWEKADIEEAIADAQQRMGSNDVAVADEAALDYTGLQFALEYNENIKASKVEEHNLREELRRKHDETSEADRATTAYKQYVESVHEAIRQNKIDRAQAYFDLVSRLSDSLRGSIANAQAFKEAEKQRIREIQHNANSDMEGRPSDEHYKPTFMDKFVNNSFVSFAFAPLATFDQMLRLFGNKSVNGEGYLYNRFMRGWVDARQKEIKGVREKFATLDAKAKEMFGGKVKSWGDLIRRVGKLPKATVSFWNGGEMQEHELSQGNLMYIYMVDKMLDGRMKLRSMGISEDDVANIEATLDPRLIELADWLQEEFLVNTRNEYNETHKRMFGASMAAIEDYFPLKILENALTDKAEDLDNPFKGNGISTATGAIIKRRRNNKALDITHADALSVVLDHIAEMEHWNAFAEFNRDLNTLRTYKRFRNQVQNMTTVYGSGKELWRKFNDVCQMAAGTYRPPRAKLDETALNFAKGATAARVSLRPYTALKQFLSFPAYLPEARPDYLVANLATPWIAWNWCMENLPIFNERWKSRIAGDPRLMKSDMDWKLWRTRIMQIAQRVGMSPNAFVDALTVCIGTHAMYQTRVAQYKRDGYDEATAEARAKQDAEVLYNQTQQSSEGAFTSTMQVDRSWLSVLFTVFRNSPMSYQRQLHDALRNLKRNLSPGGYAKSIEFMKKQMVRDGLDEDTAEASAKRKFRRQIIKDLLRVATFGYIMQLAWNLGSYLPYILFGDDDDEKNKMWDNIFAKTYFGSVEGLTGGDVISEAGRWAVTGDGNAEYMDKDMPVTSDIMAIFKKLGYGKGKDALTDIVNLVVQSGIGVNPQSITDGVLGIMDACGDDPELAHEAAICVSRILQVPQSQIDKMYFDEVGLSGSEVSKYTPTQLAERYARYKVKRGHVYSPWTWDDEGLIDKQASKAKTTIKERVGRMGDQAVNDAYLRYEEVYKGVNEKVKAAKETAKTDYVEGARMMQDLQNEDMRTYQAFKQLDGQLDKIAKNYLNAKTPEEAALCLQTIIDYKKAMVNVLGATDIETQAAATRNLSEIMQNYMQKYTAMQPQLNR